MTVPIAAIVAALVVAGCGGSSDKSVAPSTPRTKPTKPTPPTTPVTPTQPDPAITALEGLPDGHGLRSGEHTIEAGGSLAFEGGFIGCPAGGSDCIVTVAADGTATYGADGGMPTVLKTIFAPYGLDVARFGTVLAAIDAAQRSGDNGLEVVEHKALKPVLRLAGDVLDPASAPPALPGFAGYAFRGDDGGDLYAVAYTDIEPPEDKDVQVPAQPPQGQTPASDGYFYSDKRDGSTWDWSMVDAALALSSDDEGSDPYMVLTAQWQKIFPDRVRGRSYGGVDGTYDCISPGHVSCYYKPGKVTADVFVFKPDTVTKSVPDADYLTFGAWLSAPRDPDGVHTVDVFATGADPFPKDNLAGLTGTATYEGSATGFYAERAAGSGIDVGSFAAYVALRVDFGDAGALGSVAGRVANFRENGRSLGGWVVDLQAGDINDAADGGAFGGTTGGSADGRALSGKWRGKFYGNGMAAGDHPSSAAGTFGARSGTAEGSGAYLGIVGAFGAKKQAPTQ